MKTLLDVQNMAVQFRTPEGVVQAVNGISFQVQRGEIVGMVGESGCGKSVAARALMRLIGDAPNETLSGRILLEGEPLHDYDESRMQRIRGSRIGMIFQDPLSTLNPAHRIGAQIMEGPRRRESMSRASTHEQAIDWLQRVGIREPADRVDQFPHEFSGGMRQRAVIATALSGKPDLLIADEPTTALDVTVQAQILDVLRRLRDETGIGILFITHDLGVVKQLCDRVLVMYAGQLVEEAPVNELFQNPRHPYTQGLLKCLPQPGSKTRLEPIPGRPPDLINLPPGCPFADRCPHRHARCDQNPESFSINAGHQSACWLEETHGH